MTTDAKREELRAKIREFSIPEPNSGCWIWERAVNEKGYGQLGWNGKGHRAHRLAYTAFVGPIPDGLHVLHRCDTPGCVNPLHLWLGTDYDNVNDMVRKGRSINPHGEKNGRAKLSDKQAAEILVLRIACECSSRQIGKQFGISKSQANYICAGKRRPHLSALQAELLAMSPLQRFMLSMMPKLPR